MLINFLCQGLFFTILRPHGHPLGYVLPLYINIPHDIPPINPPPIVSYTSSFSQGSATSAPTRPAKPSTKRRSLSRRFTIPSRASTKSCGRRSSSQSSRWEAGTSVGVPLTSTRPLSLVSTPGSANTTVSSESTRLAVSRFGLILV